MSPLDSVSVVVSLFDLKLQAENERENLAEDNACLAEVVL